MKHRIVYVTWGTWCVSYTSGPHIDGVKLNLFRYLGNRRYLHGNGNGQLFPTVEAAQQWALRCGYLQRYFTEPGLRARRKARGERPVYRRAG